MLKIKELREIRNLQQKDLAKALFRTTACISSWETGKTEPSIEDLKGLALALDTSIDCLVGANTESVANMGLENLSPVQIKIVNYLKKLSVEDQYQVLGFVKSLIK